MFFFINISLEMNNNSGLYPAFRLGNNFSNTITGI